VIPLSIHPRARVLLALAALGLAACGGGDSYDSPTAPAPLANLNGNWISPLRLEGVPGSGLADGCFAYPGTAWPFNPRAELRIVQTGNRVTGTVLVEGDELYRFEGTAAVTSRGTEVPLTILSAPPQVIHQCVEPDTILTERLTARSGGLLLYAPNGAFVGEVRTAYLYQFNPVDVVAGFPNLVRL
jgi:hypothetical protein